MFYNLFFYSKRALGDKLLCTTWRNDSTAFTIKAEGDHYEIKTESVCQSETISGKESAVAGGTGGKGESLC